VTPTTAARDIHRRVAAVAGVAGRHYAYPGQRAFSLVARALRRFPPPGDVTYSDPDGYVRVADLRDHMESRVFVGRHRLPKAATTLLRPGDWAIDIGANVGSIAGQMCRAVGSAGLVWAFEPIPRNVARLQGFQEANGLSQLRIFDCALSSTSGNAPIRVPDDTSSGHASFTASWIDHGRLEVPVRRLDDLTAGFDDAPPLRLVKLDVEGFESEVLAGAEATIRRFRPWIHCEFNDIILRDAGSSSEILLQSFEDLGYRVAPAWRRVAAKLDGRNVDLLLSP